MFKALAYCNQRYVSSLKLVRERLMQPEDAEGMPPQEENDGLYEERQEGNGRSHEDAGQPEESTEAQETGTPEDAGFQKADKGAWYAAAAANGRQDAPAGKEKDRYGHGILK